MPGTIPERQKHVKSNGVEPGASHPGSVKFGQGKKHETFHWPGRPLRLSERFRRINQERGHVVSCLHRKGMKLSEIVAGLASVYYGKVFDESRIQYCLHEGII
jgi:hypothetical protein